MRSWQRTRKTLISKGSIRKKPDTSLISTILYIQNNPLLLHVAYGRFKTPSICNIKYLGYLEPKND